MSNREKTLWMTRTGAFIALLVVLQAATAPLGNTLVTGTLVNGLLAVSVMTCGVMSGAAVAVISPIWGTGIWEINMYPAGLPCVPGR